MIIDITDASSINYSQPLNPQMLAKGGMLVNSSQKGLKFRFDKRYAMQKIEHDVFQTLGIESVDDFLKLCSETLQMQ